ncbi:MAG: hypothetical protein ACR2PM_05235 [Hyphomicrobiales bacterium]
MRADGNLDQGEDPATCDALEAGALNLLENCVGVAPGDRVLIVREDAAHGYYDDHAPTFVAEKARALGARVETFMAPLIDGPESFPRELRTAMADADHTIFFCRIGDQVRFAEIAGAGTKTMCYALDRGFLGSGFCALPHGLMEEIKRRLEAALDGASAWRITCPLGSDACGTFEGPGAEGEADDFSLRLFPVTTFRPVPCATMNGRVALSRWLMATGSRTYTPSEVALGAPVFAVIENGRIVRFEGDGESARNARAQHDHVGATFGIDPDLVHSWHVGINPQTFYPRPAESGLERWGGISFGSPRYLHFHACGDYAPGEICWSLFDATVEIDGERFWTDGRFSFLERDDIAALIAAEPAAAPLFEPRSDLGI